MSHINRPQAFITSFAPRLRTCGNALITPVTQLPAIVPGARTTKRGTTAINYAEDGYDDDDFDDSEGPRRPTGLRSLRRAEASQDGLPQAQQIGKEIGEPVDVQGIWRDWMAKPGKLITEKQQQVQCALPLTLIPIRIDLDIPSFRPEAPLPAPNNPAQYGIDETLPAYRAGEPTPAYRLKDAFLWNLHEALMTPDQFAKRLVEELDLPQDRRVGYVLEIAKQIRSQLEDYAGVALHPLFQAEVFGMTARPGLNGSQRASQRLETPLPDTPRPLPNGRDVTPRVNGSGDVQNVPPGVSARAELLVADDPFNPDDTYRCVVNLNVNLLNKLYSDKFEWSLVHPPGVAEAFAKRTCADLGLGGEWVMAMAHAIYEAVLRLKKDACEGGLLSGTGDINNEAAFGHDAGWRFDPETLGDSWEPKLEELSKEEIEKREGDRERQLRRARRETARFSSTTNIIQPPQNDLLQQQESQDQPMGRGERSKKKRRFRSLSPLGRQSPDIGAQGYGGGNGSLLEQYGILGKHTLISTVKDRCGGAHIAQSGVLLFGQ